MDIKKLQSLSLNQEGIKTLLDLSIPVDESLFETTSDELYVFAERLYELWIVVIFQQDEHPVFRESDDDWAKIVCVIGIYYDFVVAKLLDRKYIGKKPFPISHFVSILKTFEENVQNLIKLEEDAIANGTSLPQKVYNQYKAQALFVTYINFRLSSLFYSYSGSVSIIPALFGHTTNLYLAEMFGFLSSELTSTYEDRPISFLTYQLLTSAFDYLTEIYANIKKSNPLIWNKDHRKGDFSNINLPELALLAARDPSMAAKYGEKTIEKRFENQISLILQTLGFYVTPTIPGSKTVDLICFPANATYDEGYCFLVEAKSSGDNYSLPTKDSRAIQEYIRDTQRNLGKFRPLKFVLIVGQTPISTIAKKLQELEKSTGIPIRYCHAQILANLRENLLGQVSAPMFLEQVLTSPFVFDGSFVSSITKMFSDSQNNDINYVRTLFSIGKGLNR